MNSSMTMTKWPLLVLAGLAACASGGGSGSPGGTADPTRIEAMAAPAGYGAESSESAVKRFLDAAASENYKGMWSVFGTAEGPAIARFGIAETEARMIVLSRLLQHQGYALRMSNLASLGPDHIRYEVNMRGTRKGDVMVPFVTVPDQQGRWYVERIDIERLSGGAGLN